MSIRSITRTGFAASLALIIFVIEAQLPPLAIPGVKPGLSNVVVLFAIVSIGKREAFFVTLIKILLGSFFAGTLISLIFSLSGGLAAFLAMCLAVGVLGEKKLWVVSVLGAVVHNFGQLAAAFFVMKTYAVFSYTPYLIIAGIVTGLFTGVAATASVSALKKSGDDN